MVAASRLVGKNHENMGLKTRKSHKNTPFIFGKSHKFHSKKMRKSHKKVCQYKKHFTVDNLLASCQ